MTDLNARLLIEAQTKGEDKVGAMASELEALAAEGGEAAPKFDALAKSLREMAAQEALVDTFGRLKRETAETGAALDKAATKVDEMGRALAESAANAAAAAQAQQQAAAALAAARSRHTELKDAVKAANAELQALRQQAKESGTGAAAFSDQIQAAKTRLAGLKAEAAEAGAGVKTLAAEQKAASAAAREAEAAQRKATAEYNRAANAAKTLSSELGNQRQALDATRDALKDLGVDTTGLSAKQVELKSRLLDAQRQAQQYAEVLGQMRRESNQLGPALEATFKRLGIRSVQQITAEIEQLQATMRELRGQKLLPEDAARAAAALQQRIAELRGELSGTPADAKRAAASLGELGNQADTAGNKIGAAAHKAAAWAAALIGLDQAKDITRSIIETGSAFEQLEGRLSTLLGSTGQAKAAFDDIKQMAAETPFEVQDLTESFAKLTAFGLQPTMEQMRALADTAASLGGGTEALTGVTLALGQAWAKGKLQGEEILQLAERGVPVWDLLAEATGRTTEELQKMASAGALGRDVILRLIDALGKANAGASAEQMARFAGAVSNAQDALAEFYALIANSGVLEYLTGKIQALLAEIDRMRETGELEAKAKAISDGMIMVAETVNTVIGLLQSLAPAFEAAFRLWSAKKILEVVGALEKVPGAAATAAASVESAGGRIVAASTRTGRAVMALRNTLLFAGAAYVADQWVEIAVNVERLRVQLEALRNAEASAADSAQRLRDRYAEISEATGVIVTNMAELDEAMARGQIIRDEATGAYLSTVDALNRVAEAAEETAESLIAADAAQLVDQFDQIIAKGDEVAEALEAVAKSLDFTDVRGVAAFQQALSDLESAGKVSAAEVRQAWEQALADLSSGQLTAFAINAKAAFEEGRLSAEQFAHVNDQVLAASFARLGINAAAALGKISPAAQQAIDSVALIEAALDDATVGADQAAIAIEMALTKAFAAADSTAAIDALVERMHAMGDAGKLGADALARLGDAAAAARQKIEDSTPGIQSIEEAFRRLGVTSQAELERAAREAEEAFDFISQSGGATAEELKATFTAYAEAAVAANGGVVDSQLKSEAAAKGLAIEVDKAGKVMVRTFSEAAEAAKELADKTKESGENAGWVGQTWDAAGNLIGETMADTAHKANAAIKSIEQSWLSGEEAASRYAREAGEVAAEVAQSVHHISGSWSALQAVTDMARQAAQAYVAEMEAIDRRQSLLTNGAARGLEDLRLRLLELEGTDEEINRARKERDKADVERQIALLKLEMERATLRGETASFERLQAEIRLYEEQLVLIDKIYAAERRQREGKPNNRGGGVSQTGGASSGGMSLAPADRAMKGPDLHIHLDGSAQLDLNTRSGVEALARKLIPEMRNLERRGL